MEQVLLVILILVAIALVITVLLQQSEGGALGMGGSPGGLMTARGAANFLTRLTAILGGAFFTICLTLAILSGQHTKPHSIMDQPASPGAPAAPAGPAQPLVPFSK